MCKQLWNKITILYFTNYKGKFNKHTFDFYNYMIFRLNNNIYFYYSLLKDINYQLRKFLQNFLQNSLEL
ncbi:hypothetical protein pb186bvf_002293 [Paramecium bursaria]